MGEHSEPKQVCRRDALAFLGSAAAFGLVASPAILAVSQAELVTSDTPGHDDTLSSCRRHTRLDVRQWLTQP